jgi:hypothetical protein
LQLDPGPDTDRLPQLFATGSSWVAFQDGAAIVLEMRLESSSELLWRARFEPALPAVTVHCGARLVQQTQGQVRVVNPLHYPLDQLLVIYLMATRQGLLVHAAGVRAGDQGLVLAGRSGVGKTTIMSLLGHSYLGLSDDRVMVRSVDSTILAYGTPWAGEGRVAAATAVPLRAIAFLHQARQMRVVPLAPADAVRQLLPAASILWYDRERMAEALGFIDHLLNRIPAYELHFRPEPGVIDLVSELLESIPRVSS